MIELVVDHTLTNKLGIVSSDRTVDNFITLLTDLRAGKVIKYSEDFINVTPDMSISADTTGYMKIYANNDIREYVIAELPPFITLDKDKLDILTSFFTAYIPTPYKDMLSLAVTKEQLLTLFTKKALILFYFHNGILRFVSNFPYYNSLEEYQIKISIRRKNLTEDNVRDIRSLFDSSTIETTIKSVYSSYSYYHRTGQSNLSLFVKRDYLRVNALEVKEDSFSLITSRQLFSGTFKSNPNLSQLLSILVTPEAVPASYNREAIGQKLLTMTSGMNIKLTKDVCPILVSNWGEFDIPESTYFLDIGLSNEDAEFLAKVKEIDPADIYSKHKNMMAEQDAPAVRGTITLYNASKRLKVVVRESKKRLSDEAAYRNRILKDYLNHAISLVCIPIFQNEFVIPEYLKKSFSFQMVNLESTLYLRYRCGNKSKLAYSEYYGSIFRNDDANAAFVMPSTAFTPQVNIQGVKNFVSSFRAMELTSTTQSRSSIFSRYFVEPFVEKSGNYYASIKDATLFGWMYGLDNQEYFAWTHKRVSSSLLRISTARGRFYTNCGLLSEKTFGIKAIMNHVFIKPNFSGQQTSLSSCSAPEYLPDTQKAQYISAMLDIFTANFVPRDVIENGIRDYGRTEWGEELAQINQILFLSEDSLNLLKGLYKCESFSDITTCLDFCMPTCLALLETLDYSKELKDHVRAMFMYFWDTTKAISEEIESYDQTEE